ncbi:MAG: universal stress protein, partial [Sphingobacteriaceae bacterium]
MKQILVAVDFSESAANAMQYALELAKVLNREVCAIHAIHPTEGINNSTYNAIFIEDYYNNKRLALKTWTAKFTEQKAYKNISVVSICNVGFLKTVIKNYAKQHQVELLVMGITGATGISGIVGSNASAVVSNLKLPTLFIPLESKFLSVPIITLATDYETRLSAEDVNALNEMMKALKSDKMQVLYVEEKPGSRHLETHEDKLKELIKAAGLE